MSEVRPKGEKEIAAKAVLPAFSSGDFFLTLSHRFLKLSDLLA